MAIRFSLFGRRTSAPSTRQQQTYGASKRSGEAGFLPASEAVRHIRDRARERLARADQAFEEPESAS
jgi:hypothetical protein